MRRTVATLLVVTSLPLLAAPVSASDHQLPTPDGAAGVVPAAPAPVPAAVPAPATPGPAIPGPATLAVPVLPAPAAAAPALSAPATPTPVRHTGKALRAKAAAVAADLADAAYTARLQAELCHARQIFCGLDRSGRYPAG